MKLGVMVTALALVASFAIVDMAYAGGKALGHDKDRVKSNAGLGNGGEGPGDTGDGDLDPGNSGANNKACRNAVTVQMAKQVGHFKPGRVSDAAEECGPRDEPS